MLQTVEGAGAEPAPGTFLVARPDLWNIGPERWEVGAARIVADGFEVLPGGALSFFAYPRVEGRAQYSQRAPVLVVQAGQWGAVLRLDLSGESALRGPGRAAEHDGGA